MGHPVYDAEYRRHVDSLRAYLHGFSNLQTVGFGGNQHLCREIRPHLLGLLKANGTSGGR